MKKLITHYLSTNKPIKIASDILFIVAITLSLYTLITTTLLVNKLPPGVCPIDNKSELYYLSITLLTFSFVLSFFDKTGKKDN